MAVLFWAVCCVLCMACGKMEVDQTRMTGHGAGEAEGSPEVADLAADLGAVARARVYFGHKSVGYNMMDGLRQIAAEQGIDAIRIVELDHEPAPSGAFFGHSQIGKNQEPMSKIDEFAQRVRGGLPAEPDIAFMKFCYVDFEPETEVGVLFSHYRSTMKRLSEEHPRILFLHTTVPLMTRTLRMKDRIRLLFGRQVWPDDANAKRHEFSRMLRETYDRNLIIDIAKHESTRPDGTREQYTKDGQTYYTLVPAYTMDRGHLNDVGAKKVAVEMVRVIARNIDPTGL